MYNFNNYDNDIAYSYDDYIEDEEDDEEDDSYEDRRLEDYER